MKIEKLDISNGLKITTELDGPNAVIFAGIHGDEPSGVHAVHKLIYDFISGNVQLLKGTLIIVICNEEALAKNMRYVHQNLNRIFSDSIYNESSTYELKRAKQLMPFLRNADFFLDLHSIRSETEPYAVIEKPNIEFARKLGIQNIAYDWAECCKGKASGDTDNYAVAYGATSVTYEAGSHYCYDSIVNATQTVFRFLKVLEMINVTSEVTPIQSNIYQLVEVKLKEDDTFRYSKIYKNFDPVSKNEIIGWENEQPIISSIDGYITLVNLPEKTRIGDDIFFLAIKE